MPRPRLLRVLRLPLPELGRAVEAAVLFHAFRVVLRVVPIRRLTPLLGEAGAPDAPLDGAHTATDGVLAVRRALRRAGRRHPDTCLPQAFAGRVMLHRRGLPSTLSLGVRDEGDGVLDFHAWLRAGGLLINWGGGPRQYAVLGTYHDTPGR